MKKLISFILILLMVYEANSQTQYLYVNKLMRLAKTSGTWVPQYDSLGNGTWRTLGSGSGGVGSQNLQQVLTTGSAMTSNNTISGLYTLTIGAELNKIANLYSYSEYELFLYGGAAALHGGTQASIISPIVSLQAGTALQFSGGGITTVIDTSTYKPTVIDASGNVKKGYWFGSSNLDGYVQDSRAIINGYAISGAGDLSADRTLSVDSATLFQTAIRRKDSSVNGGYYPYATNPKNYLVAADLSPYLTTADEDTATVSVNGTMSTHDESLLVTLATLQVIQNAGALDTLLTDFYGGDTIAIKSIDLTSSTDVLTVTKTITDTTWSAALDIVEDNFRYAVATATDANYTITTSSSFYILPTISTGRTLTFPAQATGRRFVVWNQNSTAFDWTTSGTVINPDGTALSTLADDTIYEFMSDGTSWVKIK